MIDRLFVGCCLKDFRELYNDLNRFEGGKKWRLE